MARSALTHSAATALTRIAAYVEGNGPIQYQLMAKYCNLWRNYDDIQDDWGSVSGIIDFWGTANGADYDNFVGVARPGAALSFHVVH